MSFKKINILVLLLAIPLLTACPPTSSLKTQKEVKDELILEIKNQIEDLGETPLTADQVKFKGKIDKDKYVVALRKQLDDLKLEKETKNLIIFKKGLYNSESANEEELLSIFNPLINRENLWQSHTLYIIAEYFFSKNEMKKSKEFFEKILELENSNPQIKLEAQKRLQRDFSV